MLVFGITGATGATINAENENTISGIPASGATVTGATVSTTISTVADKVEGTFSINGTAFTIAESGSATDGVTFTASEEGVTAITNLNGTITGKIGGLDFIPADE